MVQRKRKIQTVRSTGPEAPGRGRSRAGCILHRGKTGFTLLEFLIALTLLAMMGAVVYSGFRMSLNSYERSQDRLEKKARARIMDELVRRQLGSLFPVLPAGGLSETPSGLVGVGSVTGAPSQFPLFYGTDESMTFVTLASFNLLEHPGLTVVRYGLAEDELGRRYFGAMETRYTGLQSFQAMVDIPPGKPIAILEGVDEVFFEYYGLDADSQTYQWFQEWRGDEIPAVPEAVRIHAGGSVITVAVNANLPGAGFAPGRRPRNLFQQLINR